MTFFTNTCSNSLLIQIFFFFLQYSLLSFSDVNRAIAPSDSAQTSSGTIKRCTTPSYHIHAIYVHVVLRQSDHSIGISVVIYQRQISTKNSNAFTAPECSENYPNWANTWTTRTAATNDVFAVIGISRHVIVSCITGTQCIWATIGFRVRSASNSLSSGKNCAGTEALRTRYLNALVAICSSTTSKFFFLSIPNSVLFLYLLLFAGRIWRSTNVPTINRPTCRYCCGTNNAMAIVRRRVICANDSFRHSVILRITFDDGTVETIHYNRDMINV